MKIIILILIGLVTYFFGFAQEAKLMLPISLSHTPSAASFSTNKKWVATASKYDPNILIWDLKTGKLIKRLQGHEKGIIDIKFSNSDILASFARDSSLIIWDIEKGNSIQKNKIFSFNPERIDAFEDDFIRFYSVRRTYYEWFLENDSLYQSITEPYQRIQSKKQSPGKKYTIEVFGRMIQLIHNENDSLNFVIKQHEKDILFHDFSVDDEFLISSSTDGETYIWDLNKKSLICDLEPKLLTTTSTFLMRKLKILLIPHGTVVLLYGAWNLVD